MNLRKEIQNRMIELGWSARTLAEEAGVPKSTVYDYLAAEHQIYSDSLEQLLGALGFVLVVKGRTVDFANSSIKTSLASVAKDYVYDPSKPFVARGE